MPTQEERLANIERKVAALELYRLYDQRKAEERTPAAQAVDFKEINENMTILLGIASGQEAAIKATQRDVSAIQADLSTLKEEVSQRFDSVEERLGRLETKFDEHTSLLTQILERLS